MSNTNTQKIESLLRRVDQLADDLEFTERGYWREKMESERRALYQQIEALEGR